MSTMLEPPPSWTNPHLVVYHGTIESHARAILREGVQVKRGRAGTDFGRGFYTTTVRHQADQWAWQLSQRIAGSMPAVLEFRLDREALTALHSLSFVRGDRDAGDFWSLVVHCRTGATGHGRGAAATACYDVVFGPVAAFWQQRNAMLGADQVSFHTRAGEQLLNSPATGRSLVW